VVGGDDEAGVDAGGDLVVDADDVAGVGVHRVAADGDVGVPAFEAQGGAVEVLGPCDQVAFDQGVVGVVEKNGLAVAVEHVARDADVGLFAGGEGLKRDGGFEAGGGELGAVVVDEGVFVDDDV